MIIPLVAGALYCATPKLDNKTDTWTKTDQWTLLETQKYGCKKANPEMPCLYVFRKLKEGDYSAECGPMQPRMDKNEPENK